MGTAVEVGAVVRLKSGGPNMTVEKVDGSLVHCRWWQGVEIVRLSVRRPDGSYEDLRWEGPYFDTFEAAQLEVQSGPPRAEDKPAGLKSGLAMMVEKFDRCIADGLPRAPTVRIHAGWKVGDRARWNGEPRFGLPAGASASFRTAMAHVPTAEERRLQTTFEVTIEAERYGVPTSVRADDGFTFDPSIDIDRLEPLPAVAATAQCPVADCTGHSTGSGPVGRIFAYDHRRAPVASGRFRLHFNRHGAAPFVWSVVPLDPDGSPRMEIAVREFHVGALHSAFAPKATPDDEDGKPSAWLEVDGTLSIDELGVARIEVGDG